MMVSRTWEPSEIQWSGYEKSFYFDAQVEAYFFGWNISSLLAIGKPLGIQGKNPKLSITILLRRDEIFRVAHLQFPTQKLLSRRNNIVIKKFRIFSKHGERLLMTNSVLSW